jgi:hypothetical protein
MDSVRITNNINPAEDDVFEWGYDEDLYFTEQDEDLLFHLGHFPMLLRLIADPDCPKRHFAFAIADGLVRKAALAGSERTLVALQHQIEAVPGPDGVFIGELLRFTTRLRSYLAAPQEVSLEIALQMGADLLLGLTRQGQVTQANGDTVRVWVIALRTSVYERVSIDKNTGAFNYARCWPADRL